MAKRNIRYLSAPIAFDIETTSYTDEGEKRCIVYNYCVSVDGVVTNMRTRSEFFDFMDELVEKNNLDYNHRAVIYVHNLAYEFKFISHYFEWEEAFAIANSNKVVRALTTTGIEFRCSYALTNSSLANVAKDLGMKKMEGDLDYDLMRHSETPLTEAEMGYIIADVQIIIALIRDRLKDDTYETIPMTKTGYVRRRVRAATRKDQSYTNLIKKLKLSEIDYIKSKKAFQGGYTHANAEIAGEVLTGVAAVDIASSYPASIVQFKYPASAFSEVYVSSPEQLDKIIKGSNALIDVTFTGVQCNYNFPVISESRCSSLKDPVVDNGRIFSATSLRVTITDVDYRIITRNYSIETTKIHEVRIAKSEYLPTPLVVAILDLYAKKTTLKGVVGEEPKYIGYKADNNGVYGMMASDPVRIDFELFEGKMYPSVKTIGESLEKDNNSRSRFLYYPWGAWVTAYSRSVLIELIMDMEDAGIVVTYCDTDSDYFIWQKIAAALIEAKNNKIHKRLMLAMKHHGFTEEAAMELVAPMDIKGKRHELGMFDYENDENNLIKEFKTLGAKRYAKVLDAPTKTGEMVEKFEITVAGLAKAKASAYIEANGAMDFFTDNMEIPAGDSGRLTHTYSDEMIANKMVDYLGNVSFVEQTGFIHLEASSYHMGLSDEYRGFIEKVH